MFDRLPTTLLAILVAGIGAGQAAAQAIPASLTSSDATECDATGWADRLSYAHPLRAGSTGDQVCPSTAEHWVEASRLTADERRVWDRAVNRLTTAVRDDCRATAGFLARLERAGRIGVWAEPDTTGGMVFFGATYLDQHNELLAIQFWSRTFSRPVSWVVAALAHESYHARHPAASEEEALQFGETCRRATEPRNSMPLFVAGAGRP
ncbi:MAG: hypothetical protein AB7S39_14000 [Gemmatimonadales bacterium]